MLTPDEVVETTRDLWKRHENEMPTHDRAYRYARGRAGVPSLPAGAGDELQDIAKLAVMNEIGKVIEAFSSALSVEGFRSSADDNNAAVWSLWQRDRMDARQAEVHRPVNIFGVTYAVALRDQTRLRSPRQLFAVYADPHQDLWPIYGLETWLDYSDKKPVRRGYLYDDEFRYLVDLGQAGVARIDGEEKGRRLGRVLYDEDEAEAHGGTYDGDAVCPIVRFINDRDPEDFILGEVEPLIRPQQALNAVNFDRLVVSRFGAFPQKYVIGWTPGSAEELARASAARLMQFSDDPTQVSVGDFAQASVEGYNSITSDLRIHIAKTAQVPVGAVIDKAENVGADTIAALDQSYQNKLDAKRRSLGESWEQYLRLKGALNEIEVPEDAEVVWNTTEARSYAQVVDGISKLTAANPALLSTLLEDMPGWSSKRIEDARAVIKRAEGAGVLERLRQAAGGGTEPAA